MGTRLFVSEETRCLPWQRYPSGQRDSEEGREAMSDEDVTPEEDEEAEGPETDNESDENR